MLFLLSWTVESTFVIMSNCLPKPETRELLEPAMSSRYEIWSCILKNELGKMVKR